VLVPEVVDLQELLAETQLVVCCHLVRLYSTRHWLQLHSYVCVCVCVCVYTHTYKHTYIRMYTCIHTYYFINVNKLLRSLQGGTLVLVLL
jgi:hypothetical protein